MILDCELWKRLPLELIHLIFDDLQDLYNEDPALQWMTMRHICRHSMRKVERYFQNFWLDKLSIDVCRYGACAGDFELEAVETTDNHKRARFTSLDRERRLNLSGPRDEAFLQRRFEEFLKNFSFTNKTVITRFGEGVSLLNKGFGFGHLINDIDIVGFEPDLDTIRCYIDWKRTFSSLFQEELLMRAAQEKSMRKLLPYFKMTGEAITELSAPQMRLLIPILVCHIQHERRVVAQTRRSFYYDPTGRNRSSYLRDTPLYAAQSQIPLHSQDPWVDCSCCDQWFLSYDGEESMPTPKLAQIMRREESMIMTLPGWKKLDEDVLCELLAEEWALKIFLRGHKPDKTWESGTARMLPYVRQMIKEPPTAIADFRLWFRWHPYTA